jgi:hypothetical protein
MTKEIDKKTKHEVINGFVVQLYLIIGLCVGFPMLTTTLLEAVDTRTTFHYHITLAVRWCLTLMVFVSYGLIAHLRSPTVSPNALLLRTAFFSGGMNFALVVTSYFDLFWGVFGGGIALVVFSWVAEMLTHDATIEAQGFDTPKEA